MLESSSITRPPLVVFTRLVAVVTAAVTLSLGAVSADTVTVPLPQHRKVTDVSTPFVSESHPSVPGVLTASSGNAASAATRILGKPRSGLAWHSGAWIGGRFDAKHLSKFGTWRGRPADVVTTYSSRASYKAMMTDTWSITTWKGFPGRLNYGLAPLPDNGEGSLASIGAGKQDRVWRKVAQNLTKAGRGNSIVRVGWESNLRDWRWNVSTSNATQFKKAYRRIVITMRKEAPGLKFEFGIGCGSGLRGSKDRLAPLKKVYPGDDVVDLVGCDTYDWWNTHATNNRNWSNVLAPDHGPGVQDVAKFARAHRKGASYAEWGLARRSNGNGGGDNPYYITAMHGFFSKNRDVVAFECYFDEPHPYLANSLFGTRQNPKAAKQYARLW